LPRKIKGFAVVSSLAEKVGEQAPTARNEIAWGNAPGERQVRLKSAEGAK
jgi:hypothetical protein